MRQGDFTKLAQHYIHRPSYSLTVLKALLGLFPSRPLVADVGAGTGKLTEQLISLGLSGTAIEPNFAMREEGVRLTGNTPFIWQEGSGEATGLPDASVDWVLMASSFHWTKAPQALREFHRILRPNGRFTALWNPRDLASSPLHSRLESQIHALVPSLKRISSGNSSFTEQLPRLLVADSLFHDLLFLEAPHTEQMTQERYLGAWRSVNDIQAQAGPEQFEKILTMLKEEVAPFPLLEIPYKTRAWTVTKQ